MKLKKLLAFVIITLIMLVSLTGCVTVNYNTKINKNGSCSVSYLYTFEKKYIESLESTVEELVEDMKSLAEKEGYTTDIYENDNIAGFKATKNFKNVSEISLEKSFGDIYVKDTEDNKIKIEKNKISQKLEIDLTSVGDYSAYGYNTSIKYSVELPSKAKTHNATEISKNGKILTWNLEPGKVNEIQYEANISNLVLIIIIIAILAILVIIAIFIKKYLLKKNNQKEQENETTITEPKEEIVETEKDDTTEE